jgi:AraC-like DNA-binding protein
VNSAPKYEPLLTVPYFQREEKIVSAKYRWNSWERGNRPYVILQWTQSGEGRIDHAGKTLPVPEGHALLVLIPGQSSYYYPPEGRVPWVFSWLNFYGELACDLFLRFQHEFGPVIRLPNRSPAASALRRLMALAGNVKQAGRWQVSVQAYAFIVEWWRELAQPQAGGESGLEAAIHSCRERFRQPLVVKELADEAGMTREHFSRLFRTRMKETPAAFLRRLRLEESATLLKETRLPLAEIAMRSGFRSARHLMLTFQRDRGINPSTLRRPK